MYVGNLDWGGQFSLFMSGLNLPGAKVKKAHSSACFSLLVFSLHTLWEEQAQILGICYVNTTYAHSALDVNHYMVIQYSAMK